MGAAFVVEVHDQLRITPEPLGCGDIINAVVGPKTVFRAEGSNTTFGGNTCAREDDNVGHFWLPFVGHVFVPDAWGGGKHWGPCSVVNGAFGGRFRRNCTYWGVISTIWRGVVRRFRGSFGELYNCGIESYKLEHNRLLISCSELDYVNV